MTDRVRQGKGKRKKKVSRLCEIRRSALAEHGGIRRRSWNALPQFRDRGMEKEQEEGGGKTWRESGSSDGNAGRVIEHLSRAWRKVAAW